MKSTPINALHVEAKIMPLQLRLQEMSVRFIEKRGKLPKPYSLRKVLDEDWQDILTNGRELTRSSMSRTLVTRSLQYAQEIKYKLLQNIVDELPCSIAPWSLWFPVIHTTIPGCEKIRKQDAATHLCY